MYLYPTLLAFSPGLTDEIIQSFLPMRVFDVKDILMNWLSSGMGELFIAFVLEPDYPKQQATKEQEDDVCRTPCKRYYC